MVINAQLVRIVHMITMLNNVKAVVKETKLSRWVDLILFTLDIQDLA